MSSLTTGPDRRGSPEVSSPGAVRRTITGLVELPATVWRRTVPYGMLAAVAIGVPSDLIDTPIFGRPVAIRPIDYLIWATTSLLIGLIFAIRLEPPAAGDTAADTVAGDEAQQTRAIWGGFVSFLSVGCPVCNQMVVALIGTSGALSWWAPVQPVVGLAAIALLGFALHKRLDTYQLTSCPLPA